MISSTKASFRKRFEKLPPAIRRAAIESYRLWQRDPWEPSLHFKKVGDYWSVRVGDGFRALATRSGERVNRSSCFQKPMRGRSLSGGGCQANAHCRVRQRLTVLRRENLGHALGNDLSSRLRRELPPSPCASPDSKRSRFCSASFFSSCPWSETRRKRHATAASPHHRHRQLSVSRLAGVCLRSTSSNLARADLAEMQEDAVICALHDQLAAGLDVITDGEQTRLDFNLSFYGYLEGSSWRARRPAASARRRTISAASTRSSASCARRAGSARWRNIERLQRHRRRDPDRRADAESQRARALHAQRPAAAERTSTPTATRSPRRCCRSCARSWRSWSRRAAARSPSMSRR